MIVLATGAPSAKVEGEQIAVRIPSGKDSLTIALDLNQAFMLQQMLNRAGIQFYEARRERFAKASAEIIAFPAERRTLA